MPNLSSFTGASVADQQGSFLDLGLSRRHIASLDESIAEAEKKTNSELHEDVKRHLKRTVAAHERNLMVNLRLATAITEAIAKTFEKWDQLQGHHKHTLKGAFAYFTKSDDEDSDFDSVSGFEDDAEVLNACLRFSGLSELCLNIEDYDEVE